MKDYEESFQNTVKIDKDGYAHLTKEELNRVDIMIQRKFNKEIGRQEKITCSVKIAPLRIHDKLRADLESITTRKIISCVYLVVTASLQSFLVKSLISMV